MRVHFIAIGGSAMHNLAIALHKKGFKVTGSDDEVFEPSRSRLSQQGLLPEQWGWFPEKISPQLDAIILGMHARKDNPELLRAIELGLKVYSYPEYLYSQTCDKTRVVIGGSHGKTTVTSMVMHALKANQREFDFMVGAQLDGFDTMVSLTEEAPVAVFEGDEYLSSPIDLRPKFLWYKPHIAVLTGVAWDHINVFTTFESYVEQFDLFADTIADGGHLIYYANDPHLCSIAAKHQSRLNLVAYNAVGHVVEGGITTIVAGNKRYPLQIFGVHNLQNLQAARCVCNELGMADHDFFSAMQSFTGAARRLQSLYMGPNSSVFFDFAHSPSKLKATTQAVKQQFPNRGLVACMELHTFSSLNKAFLPQYKDAMAHADKAFVYFSPEVMAHKRLEPFSVQEVADAFGQQGLEVFTDSSALFSALRSADWADKNLLLMTSGNFDGVNIKSFVADVFGD
jgi:UDP-N-acetylmuramate: L-alanyl-gamma-D-glutamyl-meso-diaminopimelate ligase